MLSDFASLWLSGPAFVLGLIAAFWCFAKASRGDAMGVRLAALFGGVTGLAVICVLAIALMPYVLLMVTRS
jgi:hypothetical protein